MGQADPVIGVLGWHDFMTSVRVLTHVPVEPRRAVPIALIYKMLAAVNLHVFWEVQFAFFLLILLFTFSRSECPCPKSFTGRDVFDETRHWQVRDVVIRLVDGVYVLCVRFKAVKQDPRIERPEARGDGAVPGVTRDGGSDWSFVGDVPGSALSPFLWYRRLMAFYAAARPAADPMFLARDQARPYTYSAAMTDFRTVLERVSTDLDYGLHGLRVTGYNLAKKAVGEALAVAHGGWKPGSNTRYDRFRLREVFGLSARMLRDDAGLAPADEAEGDASEAPPTVAALPEERAVRVRTTLRRHAPEGQAVAESDEELAARAMGGTHATAAGLVFSPVVDGVVAAGEGGHPPLAVPAEDVRAAPAPVGAVAAAVAAVARTVLSPPVTRFRAAQ